MKNKFTLLIAILILTISNLLNAGDTDETNEIAAKLNALQGTSNAGREYLFSIPPPYEQAPGGNFIRVFVLSPVTTNVKVGVGGSYKSFKSQANGLTVIDLPAAAVVPFPNDGSKMPSPARVYKDKSINIIAEEPVIVYIIVRYKYTTDGFLAIPTSSLGKEYAIANMPQWGKSGFNLFLSPFVNITSAFDKTKVSFTMGGGKVQSFTELDGGQLLGTGETKSWTLNKGETLVFGASSYDSKKNPINGDGQDLSGSRISANRPIAVVTGHSCANIPIYNSACDYIVEMELPTTTWGKNIIVPNLPDRKTTGIIRLFGKEIETDIYRNNDLFKSIAKTVGAEGESFITERVWPIDNTPRPAVFTSSKPFNAVFFNPGQSEDNIPSDPFSMNLIPIEQYQNDMYLCTPNAAGGDPFNTNWLNLVIEADENGLIPNDFEFGTFTSDWQWQKVRNMNGKVDNSLPAFRMDNNSSNPLVKYLVKNIALPYSGLFRLRCSTRKFTSYSYGYGSFEAYGYLTGTSMKDLTTEDRWTPIPTYTMECDGERGMAIILAKVLDPIINNNPSTQSKLSDIYMKRNESYNYDFIVYSPIEPGETELTSWNLRKINPREDSKAVLVFIDNAGNDTTITIQDIATKLDLSKDTDFGNFKKNEPSVSRTFTITNNSKKIVQIEKLKLWRGNEGFKIEPLNWSISQPLQIGETRDIKITFTPDSNIPKGKKLLIDSLGVGDSCIFMNLVEVRASLGEPRIKADDWNFGTSDILFPSPLSKNIRLSNPSQEADLKITKASKLNDSSFTASFNLSTIKMLSDISPTNPLNIKANSFIDFTVYFKPNRVGLIRDSIVFTSDADSIDNITYLNGIGIDSISLDVSEEFISNIDISKKANSIYINNSNQEQLSYRLSDLQGKLISTGMLNSTNEITLKEQSAQAMIIEIINKESKVLIRKKLILER